MLSWKNRQHKQGKKEGRDKHHNCLGGISELHTRQMCHQKTSNVTTAKKMEVKGATTILVELTNCIQDNSDIEKPAA
jgi:hypothetical protein